MSKKISITLNDGLYDCAVREAIKRGNVIDTSRWIANIIRGDLRARLSKNGYTPEELDRRA